MTSTVKKKHALCDNCRNKLANECMGSTKLKRHLYTKHKKNKKNQQVNLKLSFKHKYENSNRRFE